MPRKVAKRQDKLEHVRFAAEMYYTLSTQAVSVRDMVALPQFSMVTVRTMQRWADEGGWWDIRQAHLAKLRGLLQSKLSSRLVAQRSEQMQMMDDILHQGVQMLSDPNLQPRNWEGVAGTTLKVVEAIDRWGAGIKSEMTPDEVKPGAAQQQLPAHMMPALSEDEARAAARAIVLMRRKNSGGAGQHG